MTKSRLPLLDAMKGLGCLAIVLHHLAVYGPMSDVVRGDFPAIISGLEIYARLAVQMFFVLAGFLVAAQLAPEGQVAHPTAASPLGLILKRYRRLATPFIFAIASAILITAIIRPWFVHDSLSAPPGLTQLLAHALLLHDLTGGYAAAYDSAEGWAKLQDAFVAGGDRLLRGGRDDGRQHGG